MVQEVPCVSVIERARSNGLGAVDNAAAAESQDTVNAVFLADPDALAHGAYFGIGLNAAEVNMRNAAAVELGDCIVINAVALDRSAAEYYEDLCALLRDLGAELFYLALAEMDGCRDRVGKVFHKIFLSDYVICVITINTKRFIWLFRKRQRLS